MTLDWATTLESAFQAQTTGNKKIPFQLAKTRIFIYFYSALLYFFFFFVPCEAAVRSLHWYPIWKILNFQLKYPKRTLTLISRRSSSSMFNLQWHRSRTRLACFDSNLNPAILSFEFLRSYSLRILSKNPPSFNCFLSILADRDGLVGNQAGDFASGLRMMLSIQAAIMELVHSKGWSMLFRLL